MIFDRNKLSIKPLGERIHDIDAAIFMPLARTDYRSQSFCEAAKAMISARKIGSESIFMMGAHVIRSGVQRFLLDMMEKRLITCLAINGAGIIHDYEFALIGATTESVSKYISEGQFGLWRETGAINDIINEAVGRNLGMGEAVGEAIANGNYPYKQFSLLAAGYRLKIPITVHVGIGADIIHEHPNCDGAATGATSYRDFLRFARLMENLEDGVIMNFGSAVTAPEIFLKALSMARNVAHQQGREIRRFTTLVCDLHDLPEDFDKEPPKNSPAYYFRPWKTMLVRTVADGGQSYYVKGRHERTIPALWTAIDENLQP